MRALQHEYPRWADPDEINDDVYNPRYVWPGRMRIVHGQRARKLRKRGVPLLPLHRVLDRSGGEHRPGQFEPCSGDRARYAWFETEDSAAARRIAKLYRDRLRSWQRMGERIAEFWSSVPTLLQREDETDREFVARRYAKHDS